MGETVLVLDCGGGTVDIMCHRITSIKPLKVKGVGLPAGKPWGSAECVDANFKNCIKDIFGCDERQWDKLVSSDAIFELMVLWEEQKVRWDSKNDVHLRIDYLLDTLGIDDADVKEKIARFNKERGQGMVRYWLKKLRLGAELMKTFFDDPIKKISRKTLEILNQRREISRIFMVGGFSSSLLLQEGVKASVAPFGVEVIIPQKPHLAVAMGAAMYGRDESIVSSRPAERTLGTLTLIEYREDKEEHRTRRDKITTRDEQKYLEVFDCFVEKGVDIEYGYTRSRRFSASNRDQSKIRFTLSVSERPAQEIRYLKDPGVRGSIRDMQTVEFDLGSNVPPSGIVKLEIKLGDTELKVTCERCWDQDRQGPSSIQIHENWSPSNLP